MPTNDFQKLVHLVERSLCSRNAKIAESVLLPAHGIDDDFREVDLLIEEQLGPYKIRVAIEATKLGKKMGIQKYDSLSHKYIGNGVGRVLVDKFVIVTEKGFVDSVYRKAAAEGIELITVRELRNSPLNDWFSVLPPRLCGIGFSPKSPDHAKWSDIYARGRLEFENGATSCIPGIIRKTMKELVLAQTPNLLRELAKSAMLEANRTAHHVVTADFNIPTMLQFDGGSYPVKSIQFRIHQSLAKSSNTKCIERVSTVQGNQQLLKSVDEWGGMRLETALPLDSKGRIVGGSFNLKIDEKAMAEIKRRMDQAQSNRPADKTAEPQQQDNKNFPP